MNKGGKTISIIAAHIPTAIRFISIFKAFHELGSEDSLHIIDYHDLAPLLRVFHRRHSGEFECTLLENGPDIWKALITKTK